MQSDLFCVLFLFFHNILKEIGFINVVVLQCIVLSLQKYRIFLFSFANFE